MTTSTILLLLVGAASTIAFTPPHAHLHRSRRGASSGSTSGSGSSSFSSSSSGAGAGSVAGPGFGGGYGGGNFGGAGQPFYNNQPYDYESLFRQFYENLQRLSQMHAAYANNFGQGFGSNSLDYGGYGSGSSAGSYGGLGNRGGFGGSYSGPGFQPGFVHTGGFGGYGGQPEGSSSSSSFGNQGGYGAQGGFGGNGAQPGFAAGGGQPGFGTGGYGGFSGTQTGTGGNPGVGASPGATSGPNTGAGFATSDSSSSGPVGAQASVSLSDRGGFGEASYFPPGLGSRIGQDIPAPSGGNFAVFSSSSSGTSDVNGKRTSYKEATYGVNDNGKVSTFSVKDP